MMKKVVQGFVSFIAFIAGLWFTAGILGSSFGEYDRFIIRNKLAHLAQNRAEYDTLFLGSSRVYHQISPEIFDQISGEAGMPTRSFNAAMDAVFSPEDSYVLEQILSLRPEKLRWVFLELSGFMFDWTEKESDTARSIYWHDLKRTSMVVREIIGGTKPFLWKKRAKGWATWSESLRRCGVHLEMFARKTTNLGLGGPLLSDLLKGKKRRLHEGMGPRQDGFEPPIITGDEPFQGFAKFDKLFASRLSKPIKLNRLSPVAQESLDRMLKAIRNAGATPILIVSPVLSELHPALREPGTTLCLDFSDVHKWAELYRKEHFIDPAHLSPAGAELYTRYIAEGWLATYGASASDAGETNLRATSALDEGTFAP